MPEFIQPLLTQSSYHPLDKTIIDDLELLEVKDDDTSPLYNQLVSPKTDQAKENLPQLVSFYSTDHTYLTECATFIEKLPEHDSSSLELNAVYNQWKTFHAETNFHTKYHYIEIDRFKDLNYNSHALGFINIYNVLSPITTLLTPFLVLIAPFFMLLFSNHACSPSAYWNILSDVLSKHAIGKLCTQFSSVDFTQKLYLLFGALFYIYAIYNNIMMCCKMYSNCCTIQDQFKSYSTELHETIKLANQTMQVIQTNGLTTYHSFCAQIQNWIENAQILKERLTQYSNCPVLSLNRLFEIGEVMKLFYELKHCTETMNTMNWMFQFRGFLENMMGIQVHMAQGYLNKATFVTQSKSIQGNKYLGHLSREIVTVKNTIDLNKNMIITGPNASGKTTVLKAVLCNLILAQQFGVGYFDNAHICPYDHFYCYLNIPDTSGRDSLFQAEARRCKIILDGIAKDKDGNHFCVFDELYSGTNPDEAVSTAFDFITQISTCNKVRWMLTTHFTKLCVKVEKKRKRLGVENHMMIVSEKGDYTYKLGKGISHVKGAAKVLKDLGMLSY